MILQWQYNFHIHLKVLLLNPFCQFSKFHCTLQWVSIECICVHVRIDCFDWKCLSSSILSISSPLCHNRIEMQPVSSNKSIIVSFFNWIYLYEHLCLFEVYYILHSKYKNGSTLDKLFTCLNEIKYSIILTLWVNSLRIISVFILYNWQKLIFCL